MSDFGTVTDYRTGWSIRPATAAEWRRTVDKLSSSDPDSYTGAWVDENDDRTVWVSGGPDTEIHPSDIAALADEAAAHGDHDMKRLCREALNGDDTDNPAWDKCAEVIIDTRMRAAEDGAVDD
jgi:hypothetical protein